MTWNLLCNWKARSPRTSRWNGQWGLTDAREHGKTVFSCSPWKVHGSKHPVGYMWFEREDKAVVAAFELWTVAQRTVGWTGEFFISGWLRAVGTQHSFIQIRRIHWLQTAFYSIKILFVAFANLPWKITSEIKCSADSLWKPWWMSCHL